MIRFCIKSFYVVREASPRIVFDGFIYELSNSLGFGDVIGSHGRGSWGCGKINKVRMIFLPFNEIKSILPPSVQ